MKSGVCNGVLVRLHLDRIDPELARKPGNEGHENAHQYQCDQIQKNGCLLRQAHVERINADVGVPHQGKGKPPTGCDGQRISRKFVAASHGHLKELARDDISRDDGGGQQEQAAAELCGEPADPVRDYVSRFKLFDLHRHHLADGFGEL